MPKGTPNRRDASEPTNCPIRVILNAVFLMISAISVKSPSGHFVSAALTTPGPDTPTLMTHSGSPGPWKAPAIKGLSSGALQNTTSLAAPMQSRSAVSRAASQTTLPMTPTASILMPVLVEPMFTDEQTKSVWASARGMDSISSLSPAANPLCTKAE